MPKVSVIVPVYNVAAYLPKCIESIQNQTEKDIEIILVDDGSPDECGAICDRYAQADARIKVLHQANSGQGIARNNGLQAASGEYVLFVDSDDWIEAELVETAFGAAKQNQAEIVFFDIRAVDAQGNTAYLLKLHIPSETLLSVQTCKELLLTDPSPCNKIMKRTWLMENAFAFPHKMYEDLIALSNLGHAIQAGFYLNTKPLYNYFLRAESTLRNGDPQKTTEARIAAVQEIYRYYRDNGLLKLYKNEVEWIVAYHGFFLPAREILNFTSEAKAYVLRLRQNLDALGIVPQNNPYYGKLSKKESAMFALLYSEKKFGLTQVLFKAYKLLKRS